MHSSINNTLLLTTICDLNRVPDVITNKYQWCCWVATVAPLGLALVDSVFLTSKNHSSVGLKQTKNYNTLCTRTLRFFNKIARLNTVNNTVPEDLQEPVVSTQGYSQKYPLSASEFDYLTLRGARHSFGAGQYVPLILPRNSYISIYFGHKTLF